VRLGGVGGVGGGVQITTHTKVGGYDDAVDTAAIDLSDRLI
jgi:hypothetical protein